MNLATGSPMAGMRTFFDEMAVHTKTAAQEMHDSFGQAVDSLNSELAKAMTGKKTDWGKMFSGMAESTAKSALKQGEGAAAKALGFGKDATKRGNTPMNPLYVSMVGGMPGVGGASNMAGGGLLHSLGIPGFASGGDPDPYGLSIVGEHGPELLNRPGPSHVTSNKDLMQTLGGTVHNWNIDARGTNPEEVAMRVRRAIAESQVASVHGSVVAHRELQARRPPKTKGAY